MRIVVGRVGCAQLGFEGGVTGTEGQGVDMDGLKRMFSPCCHARASYDGFRNLAHCSVSSSTGLEIAGSFSISLLGIFKYSGSADFKLPIPGSGSPSAAIAASIHVCLLGGMDFRCVSDLKELST